MNEIKKALNELKKINGRYGLQNKPIVEFLDGMDKELLCVPIVGAFSSGKSAAINTLLGYKRKILIENIRPEAAVSAEIQYKFDPQSAETVRVAYADGRHEEMPLSEYIEGARDGLDAGSVASVRLYLENEFFEDIKRVMLVDMPGFGSGIDVHDKAINNYADSSIAYIIAFPADDLTMRDGVGDILKELSVLNKPVCAMITKSDKAPPREIFRATMETLKKNLAKYIGDREVKWLETSSKQDNVEDLKKYLLELQEKSETLLREQKFLPFFGNEADKALIYLRERQKKSGLSESELKEQEDRLNAEMERLMTKFAELERTFRKDTEQCAEEIADDVRMALHSDLDDYISMAMNQTDERRIFESINTTVRVAANKSAQQRFVSKARQFVENLSAEVALADFCAAFTADIFGPPSQAGASFDGAFVGSAAAYLAPDAVSASRLASSSWRARLAPFVMIPVVGLVLPKLGLIAAIIGGILIKKKLDKARSELREQFVSQVFPGVLQQLQLCVTTTLARKTNELCTATEQQLQERKAALEKALTDCRKQRTGEAGESSRISEEISADIQTIEGRVKSLEGSGNVK